MFKIRLDDQLVICCKQILAHQNVVHGSAALSSSGRLLERLPKSPGGLPRWQYGKNLPASSGDTCLIPEWGRSPEEEMATHPSILAWRIPGTENPGQLHSVGSQRVRHDLKWFGMHAYKIPRPTQSESTVCQDTKWSIPTLKFKKLVVKCI